MKQSIDDEKRAKSTRDIIFMPMGHHHHARKNIGVAFFINLIFTIIELIGGLMTNSLAILSDAIHDLGDCMSLGLAWYLEKLSGRGKDSQFSYGYRRFSIMGASITSSILVIGSGVIIFRAIPRLIEPEVADGLGMIWLAVIGVVFNGLAAYRLMRGSSLNERTVYLHLLEDVLGWVAVFIGALLIYYFDWYIVDPILSIAIAIFVLYNAIRNLLESTNIFLQRIPEEYDLEQIRLELLSTKKVKDIHDLHLWTLDGEYHILTAHVVVDTDTFQWEDTREIKATIKALLRGRGIPHATLEFEMINEECNDSPDTQL